MDPASEPDDAELDVSELRAVRASLEALAAAVESMDEDAVGAADKFREFAGQAERWKGTLERLGGTSSSAAAATTATTTAQNRTKRVLLASSSKWRRALVASVLPAGFELVETFVSPDIDEKAIRRDDPGEMVLAIANGKMDSALGKLDASDDVDVVICADQVVVFNGSVREKPTSEAQAREHLLSYGSTGFPAECVNGVVVCAVATGERFEAVTVAKQWFKRVPVHVAEALIRKGDVMNSAGSFVVEDALLKPYLDRREGEIEAIQGMPAASTRDLVERAGRALATHAKRARRL